jgi:molecular chaperone DnaK (HSP70)
MQLRLRDFLGKKFNEMKKTSNDVFKNPRAMAKLFKEAGRLKNVLSANADHFAQVSEMLLVLIEWMKLILSICRFHINYITCKIV